MPRRTALFRNSCNVFRASACAFTTTLKTNVGYPTCECQEFVLDILHKKIGS
ncbi:hypothetical protein HH193_003783 [Escherichia coli]|nr:hypothetical protein [Escherichia coli]HAE7898249.1 hypothetical protein [Salmonella enterica subsp. enterica serovar Typhimurium]